MPLFGKRKAEQEAEKQRTQRIAAGQRALEAAQSDLTQRFRTWLDAVEQARVEADANVLTGDIINRVGPLPLPQVSDDLLNRTQYDVLAAYGRTFCTSMLERQKIAAGTAVVKKSQGDDTAAHRNAVEYWESVEAYAAQTPGRCAKSSSQVSCAVNDFR